MNVRTPLAKVRFSTGDTTDLALAMTQSNAKTRGRSRVDLSFAPGFLLNKYLSMQNGIRHNQITKRGILSPSPIFIGETFRVEGQWKTVFEFASLVAQRLRWMPRKACVQSAIEKACLARTNQGWRARELRYSALALKRRGGFLVFRVLRNQNPPR